MKTHWMMFRRSAKTAAALLLVSLVSLGLPWAVTAQAGAEPVVAAPLAADPQRYELGWSGGFDGQQMAVGLWVNQQAQIWWCSPDGEPLGAPQALGASPYFPPACAATYTEPYFLAAWTDDSGAVWLQRFSRQRELVESPQLLLMPFQGRALMVRGLAAAGARALLLLQDNQADGRGSLYAQWLNADGSKHGTLVLLRDVGEGEIELPAMAAGSQGVLAVWQWDNGEDLSAPEGRMVRANSTGAELGDLLRLGAASSDDNPMAVAFDGDRFLAVWNYSGADDPAPGWNPQPELVLHGRFVTAGGELSGPEFTLVSEEHSHFPGLAFDGNRYLLVWSQSVGAQETTWFRYLDRNGTVVGERREITGLPAPPPTETGFVFPTVQFVGTNYLAGLNALRFVESGEDEVLVGSDLYGVKIPMSDPGPAAEPARLTFLGWSAQDRALLRVEGTAGATYRVESAPEVAGPWSLVGIGSPAGAEASFLVEDNQPRTARRFYRAVGE